VNVASLEAFDSDAPSGYRRRSDKVQGETMTVLREVSEIATETTATRREWIRPALQRIAAGSAELGSPTGTPDLGVTFS
jgi:hypothetical protein